MYNDKKRAQVVFFLERAHSLRHSGRPVTRRMMTEAINETAKEYNITQQTVRRNLELAFGLTNGMDELETLLNGDNKEVMERLDKSFGSKKGG